MLCPALARVQDRKIANSLAEDGKKIRSSPILHEPNAESRGKARAQALCRTSSPEAGG